MGGGVCLRLVCAGLIAGLETARAGPKEDGDAAFSAGRMGDAEAAYTQALAAAPNDAHTLMERGRARQALGKRAEAAGDFDQAVQAGPANYQTWRFRGIFRLGTNDPKGALEDFNRALDLSPSSAPLLQDRAVAEVTLKDYAAAIVDCTRAIQIRPDFILAYSERGIARQLMKDPDSALRDFEAVIKLDPRNVFALTRRAMIYEARGNTAKAETEYRIVLALDPKQKAVAGRLAALEKAGAPGPAPAQSEGPAARAAQAPRQRGEFRLASSVEYTFDRRSVAGCGADLEWTGDWQTPGGDCAVRWHWTVPQALVPTKPATVRIEGSVTGNASESACIALETTDARGEAWSRLVVASRVSNVPGYRYPANAADDFDIVLPNPGGAGQSVRLRNDQELRHIAGDYDQGIAADSSRTPGQVKTEDCPIELGAGRDSPKELVLGVYAEGDLNRPLAQYTYRWAGEAGQQGTP